MLTLGLTLTMLALTALPLALRARVTARGIFCRRCRFDLAGLDHARSPTCPECGRDLRSPNSTRSTLRAANPPMLVVAACLMLLGIAGLTANAPSVQAFILSRVSDPALVWLDRAGLNRARAEVLSRLARNEAGKRLAASVVPVRTNSCALCIWWTRTISTGSASPARAWPPDRIASRAIALRMSRLPERRGGRPLLSRFTPALRGPAGPDRDRAPSLRNHRSGERPSKAVLHCRRWPAGR